MADSHNIQTLVVPEHIQPERIDKYLASLAEFDLSRAFIQQLIVEGQVAVDGKPVAKNHRLKGGETIVMQIIPRETADLTPENIPFEVVFEDEYLAVVNKPAGLVVHPAPGNPHHTLVNALLYRFGRKLSDADDLRPGIIHRLDKDTSGLLLVAKTDSSARKLREQLAARKITKIYNVIICGHMPETAGTIQLPIGRSLKDRKKMVVTTIRSREAITHYTVLERFRINDLVEVNLETGRTHQIRVHFSHLNRPVLGDSEYGGRQKWLRSIDPAERMTGRRILELIPRQALHARTLVFAHPETGEPLTVTSELPEDMKKLLIGLREQYS